MSGLPGTVRNTLRQIPRSGVSVNRLHGCEQFHLQNTSRG
jgi:hypothetical protein